MTRPASVHIRANMRKDSIFCGGGRANDLDVLASVPIAKWKPSKKDCGRCIRIIESRKEK